VSSPTCPGCTPQSQGYSVQFARVEEAQSMSRFLANLPLERWTVINDTTIWLEDKLFYDYLAYWTEFAPIESWIIRPAGAHPDGTLHTADKIPHETLSTNHNGCG